MATLDRLSLALEKGVISVHHHTFGGSLQIYDNCTSSIILNAALSGRPSVDIHSYSRGRLTIDLVRMKEVDLRNGTEGDVVIESSYWDVTALVSSFFASTKTVRHQILSLLVEKQCHESYVETFVKEKVGFRQFISYRSNPFISCTHHSLYTRFLESFENAIEQNREGLGRLFEKFRYHQYIDSNQERDMIVHLCFHGTNHEWMDSIMQNGMDPTLRRRGSCSDWFATDALRSIPFTVRKTSRELVSRDGIKLLVFLVIKEVPSTVQYFDPVISIHSSQNQLPIGQVTLRQSACNYL